MFLYTMYPSCVLGARDMCVFSSSAAKYLYIWLVTIVENSHRDGMRIGNKRDVCGFVLASDTHTHTTHSQNHYKCLYSIKLIFHIEILQYVNISCVELLLIKNIG